MLCVLGSSLMLGAGGRLVHPWTRALCWGAMAVGMIFFTGVALINGGGMHFFTARGAPAPDPLLYDAFNRLLIRYGWPGEPPPPPSAQRRGGSRCARFRPADG